MATSLGTFRARKAIMGDSGDFTVDENGIATFPIGPPTFQANQVYPNVGATAYTSSTGLGITASTTPSEAISKVDSWLETYLLDAPPLMTSGSGWAATDAITVSWVNPAQKKLAFAGVYIPQVTHVRADIIASAENVVDASGARTWPSAKRWTVTMETIASGARPAATQLRILLDFTAGTSGLSGGIYSYYGTSTATRIVQQTSYDIRIYGDNESTTSGDRSRRYLEFLDLATLAPGTPAAPLNLVVNSITSSTALADWSNMSNEDRDLNSDATPVIVQYVVNLSPTSTVRYGGLFSSTATTQSTTLTSGTDSPSQLTLTSLLPGTVYGTTVQAKNALNASFGPSSSPSVAFTTSVPTAPAWFTTAMTITSASTYQFASGASAYTLNGSSLRSLVWKYTSIAASVPTTATSSGRVNWTVADTSPSIGTVACFAGVTGSEAQASITTGGFGTTISPTSVTSSGASLVILSEGDASTGSSAGFYKVVACRGALVSPSVFYRSSDASYSIWLRFSPSGGSVVTTTPVTFYVDELSGPPTITSLTIHSVSTNTQYITGVPTLTSSASLGFQITATNLASRFLRSDLYHFHADIQTSTGTNIGTTLLVTKSSINGTTRSYYTAPEVAYTLSTTKHNTTGSVLAVDPGAIQFNEFSITLSNSSGRFDENLRISATAYNLDGSTSTTSSGYTNPSNGTVMPLRIDMPSVLALSSLSGTLMSTETGQYPSVSSISTYTDHSTSITGTDQLQLVNGVWASKGFSTAYKNYSPFYFPGGLNQPDYSGISASGFRYVCLRYQNLKGSGTYDAVTLAFTATGLTLTPSSDTANFRLYIKTVGTTTTPWVSATASINPSGYGAISSDGQGAMDNSNATVGSIRVYVPTGTPASATIYVRMGLDMSLNQTMRGMTCTAV
jgi:hypothetical protein